MMDVLRCNLCGFTREAEDKSYCNRCGGEDCSLVTVKDTDVEPEVQMLWYKRGERFSVVAKRDRFKNLFHDYENCSDEYWHWTLYVYLFEGWPELDRVRKKELEPCLHGGESWRQEDGRHIELGCDYNHLGDDRYRQRDDFSCILHDFEQLYLWAHSFTSKKEENTNV